MNPKIAIAVDAKNKAVATITGMATVGAKIDVEVTGITATDVPSWGSDDDYTGYSLRFRIVDVMGKDLVRYQLNKKTSTSPDVWTCDTANNKFTATNVDFDTDVLRKAFVGVPFNETLEFGIILDSYVDKAQYAIGKIKIRQWAAASTEDPTVLPDWRETLAQLEEDLEAVEASKTAAAASATSASESASSASASASAAEASKNSAATSASNAAETIKHYPKVGENGNWYVWNPTTSAWEDSGKCACGYASWFYDNDDHLYHKVLISKNSLNEYVVTVDQTGVSTPTDEHYVNTMTNQTVGGVKTFTSSPVVPTPTTDMQAATKKYADDAVAAEATARNAAISAEVTNRNTAIAAHTSRTDNPHSVTKAQVGLGNCDNTSDANKPVSTAQAAAIAALTTDLTNNLVHKTGAETITGAKNFTGGLQTNGNAVAADNAVVKLTGDQTIAGTKTFTNQLVSSTQLLVYKPNIPTSSSDIPTENKTFALATKGSEGVANFEGRHLTTGYNSAAMFVYRDGSWKGELGIRDTANGPQVYCQGSGATVYGSAFAAAAMPFVYSSSTDEYVNNVIDFTTTTQQDVTAGSTKNRWLCIQASFDSDAFVSFTINKVSGGSSPKMYFYRKDFKAGVVDGLIIPIPAGAYVFVTKPTIPSTIYVNRIIYCAAEV